MIKFYHSIGDDFQEKEEIETIVRYCENCNTEIVGNWDLGHHLSGIRGKERKDYYKDYFYPRYAAFKANKEIKEFVKIEKCPYCGALFVDKPGYHIYFADGLASFDSYYKKEEEWYAVTDMRVKTLVVEHVSNWYLNFKFFYDTENIKVGDTVRCKRSNGITFDSDVKITEIEERDLYFDYFDITSLSSKLEYFRNFRKHEKETATKVTASM